MEGISSMRAAPQPTTPFEAFVIQSFQKVFEKLEEHDEKFEAIFYCFDQHEHRLVGIESRLDGVETRLGSLESTVASQQIELRENTQAIRELYHGRPIQQAELDLVKARVTRLEQLAER